MSGTILIRADVIGSRLEWTCFAHTGLGRWFTPGSQGDALGWSVQALSGRRVDVSKTFGAR
jgi:hypothetical protein